jgi:peroxiredoxin
MRIESNFFFFFLIKDESLNICKDTVRHKLNGDTTMIAFELIHDFSTNEIQYVWLDENNNRSEKAIIIPFEQPLKEGKKFPDLTVELLNGEKLSFIDFVGKTVVVNWWHIACAPCIAEMPGLNKLVKQYEQNPNVVFVAIAQNKKEHITRFLEEREFNYIQALANEEAAKLFGESFPVHLIINSEGKIHNFSIGGNEEIYIKIEKILNELLE